MNKDTRAGYSYYFASFYYRNSFFKRGACNAYLASKNGLDARLFEKEIAKIFGHKIVIMITAIEISKEEFDLNPREYKNFLKKMKK